MATQLERDVRFIKKTIETHIGDGGRGVHALANTKMDGFMSADNVAQLQSIFEGRTPAYGQDVNELKPGFYYGSGFTNAPAGVDSAALCEVDVNRSLDGYKQITFRHNFENRIWTRTQHKGVYGTWACNRQETLLWSGSTSEPNKPMQFAEAYTDFKSLKFVTTSTSNSSSCWEANITGDYIAVPWTNLPDPTPGQPYNPQVQVGEIIVRLSLNKVQFYIQWNTAVSIISGSVKKIDAVGTIKEIWGVR